MADITKFIPFILHWASGVNPMKGESAEALFNRAKRTGWCNHPLDRGGATQCDVTLATYTHYYKRKRKPAPTKDQLKNITFSEWLEILKGSYWDIWKADHILNQSIAHILVDWVWASGAKTIAIAQRIIGVTPDGIVGQQTLTAINESNPSALFIQLHNARIAYVNAIAARNPSQKIWLKGWLNRINAITYKSA
ncbi:MAG: peptidoglycan domain protein [Muribaculaceae bacterium]|nr:peptidoglycan domain protein [Muribaculaceae bacterium]